MKLARRALDDPHRKTELQAALDDRVSELLAEANDDGYSTEEAMDALQAVVKNQAVIAGEDPDPADDPDVPRDEPSSDSMLF
jgi:predicted alpha/beta hydrolase